MTELALFIVGNKFIASTVLVLIALFLYLRLTGYGQSLEEQARRNPKGDRDLEAEADFFISYGDYERAAQVTREALLEEPDSAALGLKLLEIYFAAEDSDKFLEYSQYYKARFGLPEQWSSVRKMGQQLLPDEHLYR